MDDATAADDADQAADAEDGGDATSGGSAVVVDVLEEDVGERAEGDRPAAEERRRPPGAPQRPHRLDPAEALRERGAFHVPDVEAERRAARWLTQPADQDRAEARRDRQEQEGRPPADDLR